MKNIVLLSDCIANLTGGAEKQIYELAKRLDKNKYKVTVISLDCLGQASGEWFTSVGCQYRRFRVVRIYGLSGFLQGIRFYRFLKKERIDIIQTYHFSSDMWGTFWGKLAGVPVIYSNRRDMGFLRKPWHVQAYRWINRWVSKIIVVSNSIRDMVLSTEGVPEGKIEVIYNGVTLPIDPPVPTLDGIKNNLVIMHVASLSPVKGHVYLLEAFKEILGQFKDAKLVLIGEDMLNGSIQGKALQMGISDHVLFLGERKDVSSLLTIADICVLPSLSEGMSNAILEYMAAGKPVIATNVGGNPELVQNGYNGLLVDKENTGQLKNALLELLQNKEKRQAMGLNGLSRVKTDFTMQAMLAHYEKMYINGGIRVLHLVSSGGFFGAERVILTLASRQKVDGVMSWVGAINNKLNPHLEILQEAKEIGLKTAVFDSCAQADLNTVSSIKRYLKENNINILHSHNYKANIIGFLATRLTRVKWVVTLHGWISSDSKLRWYESLDRLTLKFADKIFCVSQNNYEMLINKGFDKNSLELISNGIDLKQFSASKVNQNLKETLGINNGQIVLAIIGRLGEEKGHKVLFKALNLISPQCPPFKCLVVGDGPLMDNLKELAKELNLTRHLIFTGNRKDVADIYKICDILVNASFTEGLPMTILEAMASGIPVIATRVGGVPQLIQHEKNGLLLEPNDPETLGQALMQLMNDPQKRQQLSQMALQNVIASFTDKAMADKYEENYYHILK